MATCRGRSDRWLREELVKALGLSMHQQDVSGVPEDRCKRISKALLRLAAPCLFRCEVVHHCGEGVPILLREQLNQLQDFASGVERSIYIEHPYELSRRTTERRHENPSALIVPGKRLARSAQNGMHRQSSHYHTQRISWRASRSRKDKLGGTRALGTKMLSSVCFGILHRSSVLLTSPAPAAPAPVPAPAPAPAPAAAAASAAAAAVASSAAAAAAAAGSLSPHIASLHAPFTGQNPSHNLQVGYGQGADVHGVHVLLQRLRVIGQRSQRLPLARDCIRSRPLSACRRYWSKPGWPCLFHCVPLLKRDLSNMPTMQGIVSNPALQRLCSLHRRRHRHFLPSTGV
eukprot:scaffold2114_cov253-Pinguiococcus_pyrenoidosus.AAC.22